MRTIKISPEKFETMVRQKAEHGVYIKIPSSKEPFVFTGIMSAGGVCVAWPDNLTEDEMKLYVEKYGDIPDLFMVKGHQ